MITSIISNNLEFTPDVNINNITQKNIIIAGNGWGKTQLIKSIRSKLFEKHQRIDIKLKFTKDFIRKPKGVYFLINEELDSRAVKDSVNPFESSTYCSRIVETIHKSTLSNGQDQKRTINGFMNELIVKDTIWFLDEPEKSLDLVELSNLIEKIVKLDSQVFIITHSPLFINDERFNKIILDKSYYNELVKRKLIHSEKMK
jgi:predicted ATPase